MRENKLGFVAIKGADSCLSDRGLHGPSLRARQGEQMALEWRHANQDVIVIVKDLVWEQGRAFALTEDQVDGAVYRQHPGGVWQGTRTVGSETGRRRCVIENCYKQFYSNRIIYIAPLTTKIKTQREKQIDKA